MDFMQFFWIAASVILAVALVFSAAIMVIFAMCMMREERMLEDAKGTHGQHGRTAC